MMETRDHFVSSPLYYVDVSLKIEKPYIQSILCVSMQIQISFANTEVVIQITYLEQFPSHSKIMFN
jgi:hypothetical protein